VDWARSPLTFGKKGINPSQQVKFDTVYGTAYSLRCFGARYQYTRKVADAVKKRGRTDPYASFPSPNRSLGSSAKRLRQIRREAGVGFHEEGGGVGALICCSTPALSVRHLPYVGGFYLFTAVKASLWLVPPVESRVGRYDCATPQSCTDFWPSPFSWFKLLVIDATVSPGPQVGVR
jgi:hypothetical protein